MSTFCGEILFLENDLNAPFLFFTKYNPLLLQLTTDYRNNPVQFVVIIYIWEKIENVSIVLMFVHMHV